MADKTFPKPEDLPFLVESQNATYIVKKDKTFVGNLYYTSNNRVVFYIKAKNMQLAVGTNLIRNVEVSQEADATILSITTDTKSYVVTQWMDEFRKQSVFSVPAAPAAVAAVAKRSSDVLVVDQEAARREQERQERERIERAEWEKMRKAVLHSRQVEIDRDPGLRSLRNAWVERGKDEEAFWVNRVEIVEEHNNRRNILAKDEALQILYNDVVNKKVISEEEFWEQRANMLRQEAGKAQKQSQGISSAVVECVRPTVREQQAEGDGDKVQFTVDLNTIKHIFRMHPAVHRLFMKVVPPMSEIDFLTRFFKSQYFNKTFNTVADVNGTSIGYEEDVLFHECEQQETAAMGKPAIDVPSSVRRKMAVLVDDEPVEAAIDLTAADAFAPFTAPTKRVKLDGVDRALNQTEKEQLKRETLFHKFNQQGNIILSAAKQFALPSSRGVSDVPGDVTSLSFGDSSRARLEDLEEQRAPIYAPLTLNDKSGYFAGMRSCAPTSNPLIRVKEEQVCGDKMPADAMTLAFQEWLRLQLVMADKADTDISNSIALAREMREAVVKKQEAAKEKSNKKGKSSSRAKNEEIEEENVKAEPIDLSANVGMEESGRMVSQDRISFPLRCPGQEGMDYEEKPPPLEGAAVSQSGSPGVKSQFTSYLRALMSFSDSIANHARMAADSVQDPVQYHSMQADFATRTTRCNELLRHYWSVYNPKNQQMKDKLFRVFDSIIVEKHDVERLRDRLNSENHYQLANTLRPLIKTLTQVEIEHGKYAAAEARRKQQRAAASTSGAAVQPAPKQARA